MKKNIVLIIALLISAAVNCQNNKTYIGIPKGGNYLTLPSYNSYPIKNNNLNNEKVIGVMNQIKDYYNSLDNYPDKIIDGWHNVMAMNNYDFCDVRKVFVENNKVTKIIVDDSYYLKFSYSSIINKAKSLVQLLNEDDSNGDMIELYFLEYINSTNSFTTPPLETGKVCFWTDYKEADMEVYLDGNYVGKIIHYFQNGTPECGQYGTLTISYKPGNYKYNVYSGNYTWENTITITSGSCILKGLTIK